MDRFQNREIYDWILMWDKSREQKSLRVWRVEGLYILNLDERHIGIQSNGDFMINHFQKLG